MVLRKSERIHKKQKININNTPKRIPKMVNFDDFRKKKQKNIIQIGHNFLIIHTEY